MLLATSPSPKNEICHYVAEIAEECLPLARIHSLRVFFSLFFFCRCHALRSRIDPKRLLLALQLDYSLVAPLFPPAAKKKEKEKKRKEKSREEGFLTSAGLHGRH